MNRRDYRLMELARWAERDKRRQNVPFLTTEAMRRYKIGGKLARSYAKEVMSRLDAPPMLATPFFVTARDLKK